MMIKYEQHSYLKRLKMNQFKTLIRNRGFTQSELSKKLGVHQTLISQWCCKKSTPTIFHVKEISKLLDIPIDKIIECFSEDSI